MKEVKTSGDQSRIRGMTAIIRLFALFAVSAMVCCLSSCALVGVAVAFLEADSLLEEVQTSESLEEWEGEDEPLYIASAYAAADIRSYLKNPSSFVVNDVYVESSGSRSGEDFVGTYTVYIDFTSTNGFGGSERLIARYSLNQDFDIFVSTDISKTTPFSVVDSIPKDNENITRLDTEFFDQVDYSLYD